MTKKTKKAISKKSNYNLLIVLALFGIIVGFVTSYKPGLNPNWNPVPTVSPNLTVTEASQSSIAIKARGWVGDEEIQLKINDKIEATYTLSDTFQNYTFTPQTDLAINTLEVHFINDSRIPKDRNVEVDYVIVAGKTYQSEDPTVHSKGVWSRNNGCKEGKKMSQTLACNGFFQYIIDSNTGSTSEVLAKSEGLIDESYTPQKGRNGWTICPEGPNIYGSTKRDGQWDNLSNYSISQSLTEGCYTDSSFYEDQSSTSTNENITREESQITSPTPEATLTGGSQEFTWSDQGSTNRFYDLHIGSTKGGRDYYDLDGNSVYNRTSATASGLPTDGSTIYVKLMWSDDRWDSVKFTETTYKAANSSIDTTDIQAQANILYNSLEDEKIGIYSDERFKEDADWGDVHWANFSGRASVIQSEIGKELRIKHPRGVYGHRNSGGSAGIRFTPQNEIYQRMTVMFEPGFDFQISGKIAGIGGPGGRYSGGNVPTNGEGFTSRFIWDSRSGQYGRAAIYLYHIDQRSRYGDQDGLGFNWKPGVRYTMTQRIKRNTGNNRDGILQIWASEDGGPHQLVMNRSDMRWGLNGNGEPDTFMVNPFHGGGSQSYSPDNDSYMRLSDFALSTNKFNDLP